jgi:hypothetical protein
MTESALLSFYRGDGTDHAGRRFDDILRWDHRKLEMVHDYIQWLFPLPEASRFNPGAPLLSAADISIFHSDAGLQARALTALDLLLNFWGLERAQNKVTRGENFTSRSANWLEPANHNHLRLTRVLLFLGLAGLKTEQHALLMCLEDIAAHEGSNLIAPRTLSFWRDALTTTR